MKTARTCWLAFVLIALVGYPGHAADKPSSENRAYQYQREARTILTVRGWHVSLDKTGKLVADHPLGPTGAPGTGPSALGLTNPNSPGTDSHVSAYAWLTLIFSPRSTSHTHCAASIVAYFYASSTGLGKTLSKPFPFASPETTKEIQDILEKAELAMVAKHPEYAAK